MTDDRDLEEHVLPPLEGLVACTLALMTGYGQALQAELDPRHRLSMGDRIADHLATLASQPQLSASFRDVLTGLQARWQAMAACTRRAADDAAGRSRSHPSGEALRAPSGTRLH